MCRFFRSESQERRVPRTPLHSGSICAGCAEAVQCRQDCEDAMKAGELTYGHILQEEYMEALAERDPAAIRRELIQVAAVAVAWVEAIDRRTDGEVAQSGSAQGS